MIRRLMPQPLMTFLVAMLWIITVSRYTPGSLVMGLLVGLAVPWLTQRFWVDPPLLRRPALALRLLGRVLVDIAVANIEVARLVLGPIGRLRPAFVTVPLAVSNPHVATMLASIVSLTPGTVSVDIDLEAGTLFVHGLDVADPEALTQAIKARYEAPLKEIFGC
jgi:multicomponent K+:H+ antiporter subunit E